MRNIFLNNPSDSMSPRVMCYDISNEKCRLSQIHTAVAFNVRGSSELMGEHNQVKDLRVS
jgi:hypothetical protein